MHATTSVASPRLAPGAGPSFARGRTLRATLREGTESADSPRVSRKLRHGWTMMLLVARALQRNCPARHDGGHGGMLLNFCIAAQRSS